MKTLFPAHIGFTFLLLVIQTYLLIYAAILLLRRLKLLKRPYNGMDYAESLLAAFVLSGVLFLSSANIIGLFQAVKSYSDSPASLGEPTLLFFARSFLIVLFFSLLFIVLSFLNIRFLFKEYYQVPDLSVSILLCAITVGFALICWFTCREVIDNITPRLINFQ